MTDAEKKPRRKRFYRQAAIGITILCAFLVAGWYVRSPRFTNFVRGQVVEQIESATGGRVEIGRLEWNLSKLEFDLRDLTVHGLEAPDEIPYIHADRVFARGKVGSLFHRALGLRYLEIDGPIVHIIVYPDGSTNQPRPKTKRANDPSPVQTLFEFSINKADIRDGKLLVNDQSMPLDFSANEMAGSMTWFRAASRYDAQLNAGKVDTKFPGMRPFSAVVESQFSFSPNAAELRSLKVESGRSRLEANGHVQDFLHPALDFRYRAELDLSEAGAVARVPQLRNGMLSVEGRGVYGAESSFLTSGKATVHQLEWKEPFVRAIAESASANFAIDKNRLKLEHVLARAMGGTVSGDVTVDNWRKSSGAEFGGAARFQLGGLAVSGVAAAFSSRSLPFDQLHAVGTANGKVDVKWSGTIGNAVANMEVVATPPGTPSQGELPVNATLRAAYRAKPSVLDIDGLTMTTPATHIQAAGTLGKTATNVRASVSTGDLGEFAPLVAAVYGTQKAPIDLHGQATFDGTVSGAISSPRVAGHVQLTSFEADADLSKAGERTSLPKRMHWDLLSANVEYGPKILAIHNGLLRHDGAQVGLDGSAQLAKGRFTRTSPFSAQIAVHNAQIADLQRIAGYEYPVSGTVDLNLRVNGTQELPRGSGRALVRDAVVYGQPVKQIRTDIAFVRNDARFDNVEVAEGPGRITGSGAYNLTSHAYRFNVHGANIRIEDVNEVQKQRLNATGVLSFVADGAGTPGLPVINADLTLSGVELDRERVGDLKVKARSTGEKLAFTAQSQSEKGNANAEGNVHLRDDLQTSAVVRFSHVDLDPILRTYGRGRLTGHSSFGGAVTVSGPLRDWRKLELNGDVSEFSVPVENIHIQNQGPVRFSVIGQVLNLQQFHLVAEDTNVSATGTVQFSGERKIDLRAEGQVNLKIIQSLNPDFTSYGLATLNVRVAGDLSDPRTFGRIQIANAGISYIDLPNGLSDMNGVLAFNRDRLQVQNLTARTGGGTLDVTGYVTYGRSTAFNLQAVGKDIRLRYPQGVSSSANANLKYSGTPTSAVVSGDVILTKFGITPQFDLANYIARSKQPAVTPKPNSPLYNTKLDVHITSTPELQVQTALAKLSGNLDLRLRGSLARPAVLGRVDIVEGDVSFNGTKYHVERGDIAFANPTGITPVFDIAANTRVRDYDITLGFHGSTDRLTTTYRSDPPLSTADIIALLAFGRTREESTIQSTPNQNLTEEASNAILGQAVNATVSSRMQKLFGVSRIKIDPEVGGAANNPSSARVTIEQQVAKNMTITYITDIARSNQQIISMEYNVTRAVSIVAVRDQYGIVSFDVRIRHRKK